MFQKRRKTEDPIVVPEKIRKRARAALRAGSPKVWIDQTLYLIGQNVTHHQEGDPLLDEAIDSAYALLALLIAYQDEERGTP